MRTPAADPREQTHDRLRRCAARARPLDIEIGRYAGTLDKGPSGSKGTAGMFGQQADRIELRGVRQTAWATTAGTFKLS